MNNLYQGFYNRLLDFIINSNEHIIPPEEKSSAITNVITELTRHLIQQTVCKQLAYEPLPYGDTVLR